jgi:putative copper export protein
VGGATDLVTGWLLFGALAVATGVVLGRWFVLPRAGTASGDGVKAVAAARLGRGATLTLAVALALVFVRQLVEFRDPYESWMSEARLLLGRTPWGKTWLSAAGLSLLAVASMQGAARGVRGGWLAATAAVLALGAFPALTGHAAGGDLKALTIVADTLHVWAAGGWLGGLALVLFLDREHRRGQGADARGLLPDLVPRFSGLAMACVGMLVLTGVVASWVHLGSVGALFGTEYGRTLMLKLALVAGVLSLGARNFRVLTPRLGDAGGRVAMRRSATLELLVANLVLAVTAILVRTAPP